VHVRTMKKGFRRGLTAIAEWCQENRHLPMDEQQKTLNAKLRGHYQYKRTPDELPKHLAVLSGGSTPLAQVAQPAHSWKGDDLGEICSHPTETPLDDAAYPLFSAWCGESRLRGESRRRHGGPKRAQSWKRRIEPRNTYNPSCSPLLREP
jgi:hypothetical protein